MLLSKEIYNQQSELMTQQLRYLTVLKEVEWYQLFHCCRRVVRRDKVTPPTRVAPLSGSWGHAGVSSNSRSGVFDSPRRQRMVA